MGPGAQQTQASAQVRSQDVRGHALVKVVQSIRDDDKGRVGPARQVTQILDRDQAASRAR
jgi:hypothetical protein